MMHIPIYSIQSTAFIGIPFGKSGLSTLFLDPLQERNIDLHFASWKVIYILQKFNFASLAMTLLHVHQQVIDSAVLKECSVIEKQNTTV